MIKCYEVTSARIGLPPINIDFKNYAFGNPASNALLLLFLSVGAFFLVDGFCQLSSRLRLGVV
jgi:hypothetical protein